MERGMGSGRSRGTDVMCRSGCGTKLLTLPAGQQLTSAGAPGAQSRTVGCPGCGTSNVIHTAPAGPGGG